MSKEEMSAVIVLLVAALAVIAVVRARGRRTKAAPRESLPAPDAGAEAPPPAGATSGRVLTARERRREEIVAIAQTERCLYCAAEAEHPMPYPDFVRPYLDVAALTTGDLPRLWRVRVPVSEDVAPVLCTAHATIARSAIELRAAEWHAELLRFVASQKDTAHEFAAHGLDEQMRAEAERVRKGGQKGGAT